ncbi:sugar transferase [Micrococcus sp.]|uniref:sugar transferase n=1 Tax=Micrococcus sp. TaxID=1271 RepID=UPI002A915CB9|nr:sugar transferase [Micrococcus sp.]MDY6056157.1 sugar transferase [Micrococcus sp.]
MPHVAPPAPERTSSAPHHSWTEPVLRQVKMVDAAAVLFSVVAAHLVRFILLPGQENAPWNVPFWLVSFGIAVLWWLALGLFHSRDVKVLGAGFDEYRRVVRASLYLFAALGLGAYLLFWDLPRGFFVAALLFGLVSLAVGRTFTRRRLVAARRAGRASRRVLLLGSPSAVQHLHSTLTATPEAGYIPVAAALPGARKEAPAGEPPFPLPVVTVQRDVDSIIDQVDGLGVDAVIMADGGSLKPRQMRALGWSLAERRVSHIMAPALTDIAGPRIHQQPVAGLSLMHVSTPRFSRYDLLAKRTMDILGSGVILLALSPVFLGVMLAIKITDPGPIFFRQQRIGLNGEPFHMIKFRSMVVDAEARLEALKRQQGAGALLFKMKDDPRVTPFGRFIRRYSVDELPQLWNVLRGDMSLVGPRPQVQAEVDEYDEPAFRRLLVKPGMTGLWQVSGRSNLTAEEAIRLDLYYVENWSPIFDIIILARTAKAVVAKDGAY